MRARSRQLQVLHRLGVQHVRAVGRRIEQAQNRQQRGFSAARWPGDRQILALLDVQMNAGQRVRLHLVGLEDLGHAVHADQSCFVNRHVNSLRPLRPLSSSIEFCCTASCDDMSDKIT